MISEKWNEIFNKLLANRIIADRISTLQTEGEVDQLRSDRIDLSEQDFPDLYKFLQEKKDLALLILYNKTEVKEVSLVYKLVERKKGARPQSYYFPLFDLSKEPPTGLVNVLVSSQDKLLNEIEKQTMEFLASDFPELHLPPANSYIRRFEHKMASSFGLKSSSQGEGRDRHVVFYKEG